MEGRQILTPPSDFSRPLAVQLQGNRWAYRLLTALGWRIHFEGLPAKQGVLVMYPHTSNWDFVVMVLSKWALGLQIRFWGKDSLFKVPVLGRWMRWLGGVPVLRQSSQGAVGQMVERLVRSQAQEEFFWLALSPEGTRKYMPGWRSGFYQTAWRAGVPLGIASLDYGRKEIRVQYFFSLTGHTAQDMGRIAQAIGSVSGLHPQQASPIELIEK